MATYRLKTVFVRTYVRVQKGRVQLVRMHRRSK